MSKFVEDALERVKMSEFLVDDEQNPRILEIRNAVLLYTNFEGRPNSFGNDAKNFNIVISQKMKEQIENGYLGGLKVNIHKTATKNPDDPVLYFINVKVNMLNKYPPIVTLFTDYNGHKSKNALDNVTIACLDRVDMSRCDVKLNIKESVKTRPGWAIFYLRQLNCIQYKKPDFDGAYDEWDDPLDPTAGVGLDPVVLDEEK